MIVAVVITFISLCSAIGSILVAVWMGRDGERLVCVLLSLIGGLFIVMFVISLTTLIGSFAAPFAWE